MKKQPVKFLVAVVRENSELRKEFISMAKEAGSSDKLFAALLRHPVFSQCKTTPGALRALRAEMGCPAPRGGKRTGPRGPGLGLFVRGGQFISLKRARRTA